MRAGRTRSRRHCSNPSPPASTGWGRRGRWPRSALFLGHDFAYALLRGRRRKLDDASRCNPRWNGSPSADLLFVEDAPPRASYRFKHALIQDAAYDSLLQSRRQALHRRAAEVLRDQPERAAVEPEVIAHHFTEAGLDDLAIEWWGKAGDQALRRSAFQEAIAHLGKAIAMADKAAPRRRRARRPRPLRKSAAEASDQPGSGDDVFPRLRLRRVEDRLCPRPDARGGSRRRERAIRRLLRAVRRQPVARRAQLGAGDRGELPARRRKRGADDGGGGRAPQPGHGAPLSGRSHRRRGESRRGAEDIRSRARPRRQVPVRRGQRRRRSELPRAGKLGSGRCRTGAGARARRRWRARTKPLTRRPGRTFTITSPSTRCSVGDPETVMRTARRLSNWAGNTEWPLYLAWGEVLHRIGRAPGSAIAKAG